MLYNFVTQLTSCFGYELPSPPSNPIKKMFIFNFLKQIYFALDNFIVTHTDYSKEIEKVIQTKAEKKRLIEEKERQKIREQMIREAKIAHLIKPAKTNETNIEEDEFYKRNFLGLYNTNDIFKLI
jgi:hypothetical protein